MSTLAVIWAIVCLGVSAEKEPPEYNVQITSAAKTDADFPVIGEYVGGAGAERFAIQLTTWDSGAFRALAGTVRLR
ncbi:hypothetical protein LBMAG53_17040 [Planctomycetota bacterium]|nr:hypothetical protein LBMAG53_17040 [Planctomycetota bacterium]